MTPVWGHDRAIAEWVADRIPGPERFGECRALAVVSASGDIAAGVVFHNWDQGRGLIEMSCAASDRRWMTRDVMRLVWLYAFSIARMGYAKTGEKNTPVRRIWKACGASETLIPDMQGEGEAMAVLTLTEPQWRQSRFHG